MNNMEMLRKKAIFQSARRAMLENELFLREYATNHLPESYTEQDLVELNEMLVKIFDNDLFDIVMGNKTPADFEGVYNIRLLTDIAAYADRRRAEMKDKAAKR